MSDTVIGCILLAAVAFDIFEIRRSNMLLRQALSRIEKLLQERR